MRTTRIIITIERDLLRRLDETIRDRLFADRGEAVEAAVRESLPRLRKRRLARECANLDPAEEQAFAEGIVAWPDGAGSSATQ